MFLLGALLHSSVFMKLKQMGDSHWHRSGGTEPEWKNAVRLYARAEVEWTKSQKYILILNWRGELPCPVITCVIIIRQEFSFMYFEQAAECLSVGEGCFSG